MNITCNNKGCMKSSAALLDTKTMEIICQECGRSISNISPAMKTALKQAGQIVRTNAKKAFSVLCKTCNGNREVVLDEKGNTMCKICLKPINVSTSFKLAMQESGVQLEKVDTSKDNKTETK